MSLPDIVYVVREGDRNEPLRHSLRSLVNVPHGRVWIAGYAPRWVRGVERIPTIQPGNRFQNSTTNLRAACQHDEVSDEFLYFNDDFYVLTPIDQVPVLHRGPLPAVRSSVRTYTQGAADTGRLLDELGHPGPHHSYELHLPMLLDKAKMGEVLELGRRLPCLYKRTLYGNYWRIGGQQVDDCKVREADDEPPPGPFVSTAKGSWSGTAGKRIRAMFPEPCRYERRGR